MLNQLRDHNQNLPSSENYTRDRVGLRSYKYVRVGYMFAISQYPWVNLRSTYLNESPLT